MSLHYLVKYQCLKKATIAIGNKTISVPTHCNKLTRNNLLIIATVIAESNCHISQFSHQMFNVSAVLLNDALKPATPLSNGAINQTLRQFAPLSDDRLLQLVDCRELSTSIGHLLMPPPKKISIVDRILVRAVWGPQLKLD